MCEVMVPRDAPTTIKIWSDKLDKDAQECRSLVLRLQGVECAAEVSAALEKAIKAAPTGSRQSAGSGAGGCSVFKS
jgi:hypothetical protein